MKPVAFFAFAFAGMLAIAAPAVQAETRPAGTVVLADHSMRSSKLIGAAVTDEHGARLGTVTDILVKNGSAEPVIVLSTSHDKMVAAPLSHFTVSNEKVTMPGMTTAMIAAMPAFTFNGLNGGGG